MELQFYGANCLKLTTRKSTIVIDDNLASLGRKTITRPQDVLLCSSALMPAHEASFIASMPGEYEIADVSIQGIAARSHMDGEKDRSAVIYKITSGDTVVVTLGHIFPDLSDQQLETIGRVDVLIVPVGNNGYTMDALGALSLTKKIEPSVVIPTHYADRDLKYEVPQQSVEEALREMAMEPSETAAKFKMKGREGSETTQLVLLERQQ